MLVDGRLTAGHARALVSVDPSRQVQLANLTVQQNWSVRQLERICAQPVKPAPKPRPRPDRELTELEDMARDLFGTRARDRRRQKPRQTGHLLLQRRRFAAHLGGAGGRPPLKTARFNKQNT